MKYDAIIFDIDGVLVDVTQSYEATILKTVNYWLSQQSSNKKATSEDIRSIRKVYGFNNDWDLSYRLFDILSNNNDFNVIKPLTKSESRGILYQQLKKTFQSFYLGTSTVPNKLGLINNEFLLINTNILKLLAMKYKVAVATGRPRFEAIYALERLKITPQIIPVRNIIALEDTPRQKPFPDPLLAAQKRIRSKSPIYVGDTINDILAAKAAKMPSIYVGQENLGDYQINTVNDIVRILPVKL